MATGQICRCGAIFSGNPPVCPQCGTPRDRFADTNDDSVLEVREFLPDPDEIPPRRDDREPSASPARRMLEALVDPRAIEWLLLIGGALSVVGLIVWLVSVGVFDDPLRKAIGFGIGTAAMLGAGWWLTLKTRFRLAGESLTFLACVVAPLNLWFYHSQHLLSVDGQLWMAGVVCCGLYAATLALLKRPMFILACQAGVTLTTLLFLANLGTLGVTSVAITLAVLGAISIHLERACPPTGNFDQSHYGRPLIWGGLAQFVAALLLLLPAQIWGWMHLPASSLSWLIDPHRLAVSPVVATVIWLIGGYLALYVALVPRLAGGWTSLASIVCLLMAETTALIGLDATAEGVVVALALTSAIACLLLGKLAAGKSSPVVKVARLGVMGLAAVPVGLGYLLLARGTMPSFEMWGWNRSFTPAFPIAMALTTACQMAGILSLRGFRRDALILRFLAAASAVLAVAGTVYLVEIPNTLRMATLVAIPIGYLVAGLARKDDGDVAIAHTLCGFFGVSLFLAVCHQGLDLFIPGEGKPATLGTAIVLLEAALLLLLSAGHAETRRQRPLGTALSLVAVPAIAAGIWQAAVYGGMWNDYAVPMFVAGGLLLAALRFTKLARPGQIAGSSLMLLTATAVGLRTLGIVFNDAFAWSHLGDLAWVAAGCLGAAALVPGWRRVLIAAAGGSLALGILGVLSMIELSSWQKVEILAVLAGLSLLAAAHVGRFRERPGQPDDLVDAGLWIGSVLTILPLAIATFTGRFIEPAPRIYDEIALAAFAVAMLATGLGWRIKATTILGGLGLAGYLVVLLASVLRQPEVTMGAVLFGIGTAVFILGVLLSIYRDYVLSLPDRIAKRQGLFQVLNWR